MSSPTSRTLQKLKRLGYAAGIVEKYNQFSRKRHDLFGIIDIVAIRKNQIKGIQTTSGSNVSSHIQKALAEPRLRLWLQAGGIFEIWGWRLLGKKGRRKVYKVRVLNFYWSNTCERVDYDEIEEES